MKKKLIAMFLLLAIVAGIFAGCGVGVVESSQNGGATEEDVTVTDAQGNVLEPTVITVATWDGGLGSQWLELAADRFEELYKDVSFEEGKQGCKINILASRSFDGSAMSYTPLTYDIYFVEGVDYFTMVANGQMACLTDIMTEPLTQYGEDTTILEKIDPTMQDYLLASDGNYYAIPFYETFYSFAYDLDLWNEKSYYFAKNGGWTNVSGDLSAGPDGEFGTSDDGMPATYAEFETLINHIKDTGVIPFIYPANATPYVGNFLYEYYAQYEGKEQMELNYSFNGVATDLIEVAEDGTVTELPDTEITVENGYELQSQAGRYYVLKFVEEVLSKTDNYKVSDTHINAQKSFVRGGIANDQPIAMILDGTWWENEAAAALEELESDGYERHNYAVMPKPHATEDKVGQTPCWLSTSFSFGFVANASTQQELSLKFLQFLHTNDELSHFTAEVNMTRPLSYTITEEDSANLTTYCRSILDLKENSDVIYPYTREEAALNNPLMFSTFNWAWLTTVDGSEYQNPWLYFTNVSGASAIKYFNGQKPYFLNRWSGII